MSKTPHDMVEEFRAKVPTATYNQAYAALSQTWLFGMTDSEWLAKAIWKLTGREMANGLPQTTN